MSLLPEQRAKLGRVIPELLRGPKLSHAALSDRLDVQAKPVQEVWSTAARHDCGLASGRRCR
jgi:hypothetical protein